MALFWSFMISDLIISDNDLKVTIKLAPCRCPKHSSTIYDLQCIEHLEKGDCRGTEIFLLFFPDSLYICMYVFVIYFYINIAGL